MSEARDFIQCPMCSKWHTGIGAEGHKLALEDRLCGDCFEIDSCEDEPKMTSQKRYLLFWLAGVEGLILFLGWYLWGFGAASMIFLLMFWVNLKVRLNTMD